MRRDLFAIRVGRPYKICALRSTAGKLRMAPVGHASTHFRQLAQKVRASSGTIGFTTVEKPRL